MSYTNKKKLAELSNLNESDISSDSEKSQMLEALFEEKNPLTEKHHNAFIYCLKSSQTNDIYIGSSVSSLKKRFVQHKSSYKKYIRDGLHFMTSFKIMKYSDCTIELICNCKNITLHNLKKIEGVLIQKTANCINRNIAGLTPSESVKKYHEKNKDAIRKQQKNYYKENRDIINERSKNRYKSTNKKNVCNCGGLFTTQNKSKHEKTEKHQKYVINISITITPSDDIQE